MFTKCLVAAVFVGILASLGVVINKAQAAGTPCFSIGEYASTCKTITEVTARSSQLTYHTDSLLPVSRRQTEPKVRWLAMTLLFVMIAALIYTGRVVVRSFRGTVVVPAPSWEKYVTPLLAVLGMAVATSLNSVRAQVVEASLYPVDSCLTVLNSSYVTFFDVFPVSSVGRQTYSVIFLISLWAIPRSGKAVRMAYRVIFILTIAGTLFSLYLTCLEVFVVRDACGWCLSAAAIMTLLMIVALVPAMQGIPRSRTRHWVRARKAKMPFAHNRHKPRDH